MATTPGRIRPWRYLAAFAGSSSCFTRWCSSPATARPTPKLGIDLQGGTRVTLAARTATGERRRRASSSCRRQQIIEQRVNGLGVSGAEVVLDGDNITITVPGEAGEQARSLGQTAQLRFREVIGQPVRPPPRPAPPPGATRRHPARPPAARRRRRRRPPTPQAARRPGAGSRRAGRVPGRRCTARPQPRPRTPAPTQPPAPAAAPGAGRPGARRGDRRRPRDPAEHRPDLQQGAADARLQRARTRSRATTTRRCRWSPATRTAPRSTCSARAFLEGTQIASAQATAGTRQGVGWRHQRDVQERRARRSGASTPRRAHRQARRVRRSTARSSSAPDDPGRDLRRPRRDHRPVQPGPGAATSPGSCATGRCRCRSRRRGADRLGHAWASRQLEAGLIAGGIGLLLVVRVLPVLLPRRSALRHDPVAWCCPA